MFLNIFVESKDVRFSYVNAKQKNQNSVPRRLPNGFRNSFQKLEYIKIIEKGKILNSKGEKLSGRNTDSESITKAQEDGYYISFESNNRVMFHDKLTSSNEDTEHLVLLLNSTTGTCPVETKIHPPNPAF